MNTRQETLLNYLVHESEPVTGSEIAKVLGVSSRTVRTDLKVLEEHLSINQLGAEIKAIRSQGYLLEVNDEQVFTQYLKSIVKEDERLPIEPEDRVQFLIKKFLLSLEYLKIDQLADELFVSRSTLQNDLKDVKVVINRYNLHLKRKPNYGLKISGSEKNIRYAISDVLFKRSHPDSYKMTPFEWTVTTKQFEEIREIILKHLRNFNLNLSDIALNNLVVHIAISYERLVKGQHIVLVNKDEEVIKSKSEYQVAEKIIKDIEKTLDATFPTVEISYVAMHLLGTKLFIDQSVSTVKDALEKEILDVVHQMVKKVDVQLDVNLIDDQELIGAIALHLKPAINRYKYKMNIRNPMLEAIKTNYPLAFEAGLIASSVVGDKYDIEIDEHEIGYIALHFGAALERSRLKVRPKRCLIVCTTGLGSSQLLLYKLKAKYGQKLKIIGTTELHRLYQYHEKNYDFIISTVPLPETLTVPHIVVSTLLGDTELREIDEMVRDNNNSIVDDYLTEEYIYTKIKGDNVKAVITNICHKLIRDGKVKSSIVSSVLERETKSATSFGNLVAIPHPMEAQGKETFWSLATLEAPIDWGEQKVQLVFLLHIGSENKMNLEPMYQYLISIVDSRQIVKELIEARTTRDIIRVLKSH